jgi:hypothetical protein
VIKSRKAVGVGHTAQWEMKKIQNTVRETTVGRSYARVLAVDM